MDQEYRDTIIRVGRKYRCIIPDMPQVMTVTSVTDTEVQFTRVGYPGIKIMEIVRFCEIAIPL